MWRHKQTDPGHKRADLGCDWTVADFAGGYRLAVAGNKTRPSAASTIATMTWQAAMEQPWAAEQIPARVTKNGLVTNPAVLDRCPLKTPVVQVTARQS